MSEDRRVYRVRPTGHSTGTWSVYSTIPGVLGSTRHLTVCPTRVEALRVAEEFRREAVSGNGGA